MYTTDTEKIVINSSYKNYTFEIDFLDKEENVIDSVIPDIVSGSVSFDSSSNSRRTCNLVLKNLNGEYIPSSDSKIWVGSKFAVKSGYYDISGNKYLFPQGVFVLGNPNLLSNIVQKEVSFDGLDKMSLLDGTLDGLLSNKYEIALNSRIDTVVKSILTDLVGESKYIISECATLTPYTITKEINSNILDILLELAKIAGDFECFYDASGYFHFSKAITSEDIQTTAPTWSYLTEGLYIESRRELKLNEVKNAVYIWGAYNDETGEQYSSISKDLTGSKFSIDEIGEKKLILTLEELYTDDLCQQRSDMELLKNIKSQESVSMSIVPNFSHDLNEVITLEDSGNGTSGNYLIQSISYNFSYDTVMSITMWRIRDLR